MQVTRVSYQLNAEFAIFTRLDRLISYFTWNATIATILRTMSIQDVKFVRGFCVANVGLEIRVGISTVLHHNAFSKVNVEHGHNVNSVTMKFVKKIKNVLIKIAI